MAKENGMKIIELKVRNIKRVRAVTIRPDGNMVVIKGKNAQGKTSTLDAIWLALNYAAGKKDNPNIVHEGEKEGEVSLDLGELKILRKFTSKGTTSIKVTKPDGTTADKPQALLDSILGQYAFDPLAFAGQPPAKQRAALLGMVNLGFDLGEMDADRKKLFDDRTDINRDVKNITGELAALTAPAPGEDLKEVAATDMINKVSEARQERGQNKIKRDRLGLIYREHAALESDLKEKTAEKETLEEEVAGLVDPDVDALEAELGNLEESNRARRAKGEYFTVKDRLAVKEDESSAKTKAIEELDEKKEKALLAADMPVDGLGFTEDGITYQGQPFSQASSAERLRVSMAIAMAMNPELRLIRITDGSLLDSDNMKLIDEMADGDDFQVWIERVEEDGDGFLIEDGELADG